MSRFVPVHMLVRGGAPAPAMIVNDPTHTQEHAVEVQIPFLQTVLGPDLTIVPLNAGDATPQEVAMCCVLCGADRKTSS